jgi:hypothetical protein
MNLKSLKPFLGEWKTQGLIEKGPMGPAGKITGTDSYFLVGHQDFVFHSVDVKMAKKKIKSTEVIAYDSKKKKFVLHAFEKGKVQGLLNGTLQGREWRVDGKGIRFRGEFNRALTQLVGEWQYKDTEGWKLWISFMITKKKKKKKKAGS